MRKHIAFILLIGASSLGLCVAIDENQKARPERLSGVAEVDIASRDEVFATFEYYMRLNRDLEELEKRDGVESPAYQTLSKAISAYDDLVLPKCMPLFLAVISAHVDEPLIGKFLRVDLAHNRRSGDESLCCVAAKLYVTHPEVVERTIRGLAADEQRAVIDNISGGIASLHLKQDAREGLRERLDAMRKK